MLAKVKFFKKIFFALVFILLSSNLFANYKDQIITQLNTTISNLENEKSELKMNQQTCNKRERSLETQIRTTAIKNEKLFSKIIGKDINEKINSLNQLNSSLVNQIKNRIRIQQSLNRVNRELRKLKENNKKCKGKKKVVPNCNIGRPNRRECHRRYGTYRGKDIECQYVWKGRGWSCDFWQPRKPWTLKTC